ncbi:huntingtin [Trichogramma pretiosum]|uniref:huntingtin n=1 Tax=Trichogramma pretiosum TaxID=7493 RepID=UPI0006C97613|nr:huntingtin [Trichogramma pretiosum]
MTALGVIAKSIENLRTLQLQESLSSDHDTKKKEKIANCLSLTNNVTLTVVKSAPQVLNLSIETLLCLCDDFDADIRTVADECLNKIIKATVESYVLKIQFELYREIKRNGAARCLKAALWRFGLLSHMIRPVKAKVFASQLTPCILEIVKRKEDTVLETLSQSLTLILKTLGHYLADKDVQVLLKAFFQNIASNEATIRRSAANMIVAMCVNCRKPPKFFNFVVEHLLDVLSQESETSTDEVQKAENMNSIFGVFTCLRLIIPNIDSKSTITENFNSDHILEHYICIYELCLYYAKFYSNHNVINAALETLAQLLQNPPENVIRVLLSKDGIAHRINKLKDHGKQWSSKISLSTTVMSSEDFGSTTNLFENDIDIPEINPKVEKWMTDSVDVSTNFQKTMGKIVSFNSSQIIDAKEMEDYSGLHIGSINTEDNDLESNASSEPSRIEKPSELSLPTSQDQLNSEIEEDSPSTYYNLDDTIHNNVQEYMCKRGELTIGNINDSAPALRYCCRLVASSFLLTGVPGEIVSDDLFRVSVKSLALSCLAGVLRLVPEMLNEKLETTNGESQIISDVLEFAKHQDPQIRGNVVLLIANYLRSVLENKDVLLKHSELVDFKRLTNSIVEGLEDESATTCRQSLSAVSVLLPTLLESAQSLHAISMLETLPCLANNPYFLVKIKLAEVVCELPYTTIEHVCSDLKFQDKVVDILLKFLVDVDQRVRKAASNAIVKIIPCLHFNQAREDALTRRAMQYTEHHVVTSIQAPIGPSHSVHHRLLVDSLMPTFAALFHRPVDVSRDHMVEIDEALSRILNVLVERLLIHSSKQSSYGYCEALYTLSETYLTSIYHRAWDCHVGPRGHKSKTEKKRSNARSDTTERLPDITSEPLIPLSSSLFSQSMILLTTSPLGLDLSLHRHLLLLSSNLAAGIACSSFRHEAQRLEQESDYKYWSFFKDKETSRNMENLLQHLLRILNIFQHVIEDLPSPIPSSSKSNLANNLSSPTAQSPKRKLMEGSSKSTKSSEKSSSESQHQSRPIFRFNSKDQLGSLTGQSHYYRLYELMRTAHSNYRITLDQSASELYLGLLNACLRALAQVLEVATVIESNRVVEEILHYLQSTMTLLPTATIQCVRQLLKSLFGTNLVARWFEIRESRKLINTKLAWDDDDDIERDTGFYEQCFQRPAKVMNERIKEIDSNSKNCNEPDVAYRVVKSIQRTEDKKLPAFLKILNRNSDQNSVGSFIRLFEPLVIKSLIQYTITNCISLQCEVLMLLSQLVQLRINYCLMDSDKIFIGFVMKQFEFIEDGHIPQTELLLPKIVDFLVRLSYEKYHSKMIIGMPKIIQLCDGLMASGQAPQTHCIPALVPVVEEMFLMKNPPSNPNEEKELETTREVLMSMMLRLAEYPAIIELIARCLTESRGSNCGNGEEKWRRWSRQALDTILPMLSSRKVRLEFNEANFALIKLFSAASPTVFRPVDPLLKVLLAVPPSINQSSHDLPSVTVVDFQRWLVTVNSSLLAIVSYAKEEAMLSRLADVAITFPELADILMLKSDVKRSLSGDPLNVSGRMEPELIIPPERILARFLLRAVEMIATVLLDVIQGSAVKFLNCQGDFKDENQLVQQSGLFLQLCIHMFETGSHCKVANASMQLLSGRDIPENEQFSLDHSNAAMISIGKNCPIISCQWVYLLTLLGYDRIKFWSEMIGPSSSKDHEVSLNTLIHRRASLILFCDYICENISDSESLRWFLANHSSAAVKMSEEEPVRELVTVAVHRESESSGLFLSALEIDPSTDKPVYVKRLLRCLEAVHQAQSGKVLKILVPSLLTTKYLVLSRLAAKLASRRVELLLTMGKDEVLIHLSGDELKNIFTALEKKGLAKKHGALVGLLNKLATVHYDLQPLNLELKKSSAFNDIKSFKLDRTWFFSQVKARCCTSCISYGCYESALLLSHLNVNECLDIFSSSSFDIKLLQECVIIGARLTAVGIQKLELDGADKYREPSEHMLFTATKQSIIQQITSILNKLEKPHEIFVPLAEKVNSYTSSLVTRLEDPEFRQIIFNLIPAVTAYVKWSSKLERPIEPDYAEPLSHFSVLCLEICQSFIYNYPSAGQVSPHELDFALRCAKVILQNPDVNAFLSSSRQYSLTCSAASALDTIVRYFCKNHSCAEPDQIYENCHGLQDAMACESTREYATACLQMSGLVAWLERRQRSNDKKSENDDIPMFFYDSIKSIIVSVARQQLVNSFVLMPPLLWRQGCDIVGSGPTKCNFALFLSEPNYIPDLEILEEFMYRISLLGWTSRQQFEEIWMVLLGVLNVSQLQNNRSEQMDSASSLSHTASLAVQAITSLLVQTLVLPTPGNPSNGRVIRHPRDPQLSLQKKSTKRLFYVQELLLWRLNTSDCDLPELEHIFNRGNLEPRSSEKDQAFSQLSVSYLWCQCSLHADKLSSSVLKLKKRRDNALANSALDVNSCLYFLLDLYNSWLSPSAKVPLRLLHELIKSLLFVSDLFSERSHFQWMLESCLDLWKAQVADDEILRRYLILAICKSVAVLTPLDTETLDKVRRIVDSSLKCGSISMRMATLHGTLYILQSAVLADCEETMSTVHSASIEYITRHLNGTADNRVSSQSQEHQCLLWALVFFLLEHAESTPPEVEAPAVLGMIMSLVSSASISSSLHRMLLQGLERLVATRSVLGKVSEQIVKISLDRLRQSNPVLSLPALQLFLTCMYTESAERFNKAEEEEEAASAGEGLAAADALEPEVLVRSIERSSAIFDKIKKAYPLEVEILCDVLAEVLIDFFPPMDILTKVIGEFLSPQQPYPRLMSAIVFKVCEKAGSSAQLSLLQTWVVFSIQNFIQSLPLIMSTWCLSCFFLSSSTNPWLRALFPHVQSRIGKYEAEDKKILCIAALDFYSQLPSDSQRETFVKTFEEASKEPGSPFADILACL